MLLKLPRAIIASTVYLLFELLVLSSTFRLMAADGLFIPVLILHRLESQIELDACGCPFSSAVALWEGGPLMNALLCRVGADPRSPGRGRR
jgi:hypothetical protein